MRRVGRLAMMSSESVWIVYVAALAPHIASRVNSVWSTNELAQAQAKRVRTEQYTAFDASVIVHQFVLDAEINEE